MSPTVHAVGGGERGGEKVVSPAAFHPQCFAAQPSLCISRVRRQKLITLPVLPGGGITIYKSGVLLTQHLPHPQAVISSTQKGLWWCRWSFPQGEPISDSLQISAWGAHPHFQQLNWRHSHLEESNTEWRHCQKADMENTMTWKSETEQWWWTHLWADLVLYGKFCRNSDAQTLSRTSASEWKGKIAQDKLTLKKSSEQWWLCTRFMFSMDFLPKQKEPIRQQ